MSNALALAGVTAVLKDLLDSGVTEHSVVDALGAGVTVSSLPPHDVPLTGNQAVPRLNLFLHQVSYNAAWRNAELPSRDTRGQATTHPPLALNLHYLLSAYGFAELQAEVLLGYGLQLLHETPVLGRRQIRIALNPAPAGAALLPTIYKALRSADLAEQLEMLKITPDPMPGEEMSRLWSAMQTPYRPSAGFVVSVVLIQPDRAAVSPLPVLRRGAQDQGVFVTPGMAPPLPTLQTLSAPAHRTPSVLRPGDGFELVGLHLAGSARRLVMRHDRLGLARTVTLADGSDEALIAATLPNAPADWPVGLYRAELELVPAGETLSRTSNALPFALAPQVDFATVTLLRGANDRVTIDLGCAPAMRPGQRVTALLGTREVLAQPFNTPTQQLRFFFEDAPPAGTQLLLRLKVDDIESVVVDRRKTPAAFFPHLVTLPV